MSFIKRFASTAKNISVPIWIAGLIIPFGFTAISLFAAYKAARKEKPEQTLGEFVKQIMKEENNDKS